MALSNVFPMMMLKDNDEIVRTSGIVTSSLTLMLFLSANYFLQRHNAK